MNRISYRWSLNDNSNAFDVEQELTNTLANEIQEEIEADIVRQMTEAARTATQRPLSLEDLIDTMSITTQTLVPRARQLRPELIWGQKMPLNKPSLENEKKKNHFKGNDDLFEVK